jgi:hypothetical protein
MVVALDNVTCRHTEAEDHMYIQIRLYTGQTTSVKTNFQPVHSTFHRIVIPKYFFFLGVVFTMQVNNAEVSLYFSLLNI